MMRSLEVFVPIMVKLREYTDDPAVLTRWKMEQGITQKTHTFGSTILFCTIL